MPSAKPMQSSAPAGPFNSAQGKQQKPFQKKFGGNPGRGKNRNFRPKKTGFNPSPNETAVKPMPWTPENNLKIIPLGGCEEVGRNMTVFEYGQDIVILDMGLQFPEQDMPGIDYVIPNTEYLKGKEKNIRAVIFSHGHLDHIGGRAYFAKKTGIPTGYRPATDYGNDQAPYGRQRWRKLKETKNHLHQVVGRQNRFGQLQAFLFCY